MPLCSTWGSLKPILGRASRGEGNIGGLERGCPLGIGLGLQDAGEGRAQLGVVLRRRSAFADIEARLRDQVADPEQVGGRGDEADVDAAELHPLAVGAG